MVIVFQHPVKREFSKITALCRRSAHGQPTLLPTALSGLKDTMLSVKLNYWTEYSLYF